MPGMHVGLISLLGSGVQTVDDQFEAGGFLCYLPSARPDLFIVD
jgi:hypothetical protein